MPDPIYGFASLDDLRRVDRLVRSTERTGPLPLRQRTKYPENNPLPLIGIFNDSGSTIPAFGVVLLKGQRAQQGYPSALGPAQGICMSVKQPDAFGSQYNAFVADQALGVGYTDQTFGAVQQTPPFIALYDNADGTPVTGDIWGPRNGTFKLKKNTGGFLVLGAYDTTNYYALVVPFPMLSVRGTIAADAAPDSSSTLTVYTGAYGAEATTSQTIPNVRNASDCTIKSGGAARIHRAVYDPLVPGWEFDVGRTV